MSYGKIYSSLMGSSLMDEGPVVTAVWALIISSKDEKGITTITPRELAKAWRMDTDKGRAEIQKAWNKLTEPDPQSSNKAHDGRRIIPLEDGRWWVVSHEKYQDLSKDQEGKVQDAIRKADERAERKAAKGLCATPWCKRKRAEGETFCPDHAGGNSGVHVVPVDDEEEEEDS